MRRFRVSGSSRAVSAAASRTLLATIAVASAVVAFGGLGAAQGRPPGRASAVHRATVGIGWRSER